MQCLRLTLAISALGFALRAAPVFAGSTVVLTQTGYSSGYGGEFTAHLNDQTDIISTGPVSTYAVNPDTSLTAIFQTFCIQEGLNDVTFYPGQTYNAAIVDQVSNHHSPPPQTVSEIGGSLFDQFWNGTLNYNYADSAGFQDTAGVFLSRQACAGALQAAIWTAQGDQPLTALQGINDPGSQLWVDSGISGNQAARVQALSWYNLFQHSSAPSNVKILALTDGSGGIAQAQLVEVPPTVSSAAPVPLPSSAGVGLAMLGGLGAVKALRSRYAQRTCSL